MTKTEILLQKIEKYRKETGIPVTLLAVCPNSISVIRAAFRAAKRNNAPIIFTATLNQVDWNGGYTGMYHSQFIKLLQIEAEAINYKGEYIVAIDHGGPWLKDQQTIEKWDFKKAMDDVKCSFEEAIDEGIDLIHVDTTVDITLPKDKIIDINIVVDRTIELILFSENHRKSRGLPPISYEVGTEEVHGGLADESIFDNFLVKLKKGLKKNGLSYIWPPCFIVGKVGTDLHTTTFDKETALKLTSKVKKIGSYIKGHYTDNVKNPEDYPICGMGAANIGPELTISEYDALMELEDIEFDLFCKDKVAIVSVISDILEDLVIKSERWKKWLLPEEKDKNFTDLSEERRLWLVKTGCRYVWNEPEALNARHRLYDNLKRNGIDAEEIVLSKIEHDLDKYFYAFNLVNFLNFKP